jgi:hypothetical protein
MEFDGEETDIPPIDLVDVLDKYVSELKADPQLHGSKRRNAPAVRDEDLYTPVTLPHPSKFPSNKHHNK